MKGHGYDAATPKKGVLEPDSSGGSFVARPLHGRAAPASTTSALTRRAWDFSPARAGKVSAIRLPRPQPLAKFRETGGVGALVLDPVPVGPGQVRSSTGPPLPVGNPFARFGFLW